MGFSTSSIIFLSLFELYKGDIFMFLFARFYSVICGDQLQVAKREVHTKVILAPFVFISIFNIHCYIFSFTKLEIFCDLVSFFKILFGFNF